jgi:RNA polymerase sigma-70 factor, ECF subfamily
MQDNDNLLVQQYLAGDEDAFYKLVSRYKKPITNFIYKMIGDYDQALDLTQETFLRVYKSLENYRSDYQFSTWIYRIASNLAIDEIRRRRRRSVFFKPVNSSDMDGRENSPEEQVADTTRLQDERCLDAQHGKVIKDAIQSLPATYRTIFILKEIEEMEYEQISQTLGCSLGTVKSRLHRAKNLLQKKLAPFWNKKNELPTV